MTLGDTSIRLNAGANLREQTTGFGSQHGGGAHLLLADGSVMFMNNAIDLELYRCYGVINDGWPTAPEF